MDVGLVRTIEAFILPPGGLLVLAVLGLLAWRTRIGRLATFLAVLGLYLLATPFVAALLMRPLQSAPVKTPEEVRAAGAQAVVVALAGRVRPAWEYGAAETLSPLSMQRLRYGAWLARRTGLPIVVTGGALEDEATPLAALAAHVLRTEFGLEPLVAEAASNTTWENGWFTARQLEPHGVRRVALVTHAFHSERARHSFEAAGIAVVDAPTGFYGDDTDNGSSPVGDWLPSGTALAMSTIALHELTGNLWYRLRPQVAPAAGEPAGR
jgi:uncharacterized SAM-binding protein YcdF (DUF218 family)